MKRLVFNLSAGISLLLCIATLGLWMLGYFRCDGFEQKKSDRLVLFQTVRGGIQYVRIVGTPTFDYSSPGWFSNPAYDPVVSKRYCGFGRADVVFPEQRLVAVDLPAYPFAVVFGILPVITFFRWLRRLKAARRTSQQLCSHCGYDLRATPDRCPECGTTLQRK